MICEPHPEVLLQKLEGKTGKTKIRSVYFFDDLSLSGLNQNILLRVRETQKKATLTLKIQSDTLLEEADCEIDRVGNSTRLLCSVDASLSLEQWDSIKNQGPTLLPQLLSLPQKHLLQEKLGHEPQYELLQNFGPSQQSSSEISNNFLKIPFDLEQVQNASGLNITELSTRVEEGKTHEAFDEITRQLQGLGIQLCTDQKSKTEQILRSFRPAPPK